MSEGYTQNPNESLNNVIRTRIPKKTLFFLDTLKFGVNEAVLSYNDGQAPKLKVIEKLGLQAGKYLVQTMRLYIEKKKTEKAMLDLQSKIRQARS